ncbi:hypothetical protein PFISCL1PPCAC_14501, partial [Pristionchus fissidentatus]
TSRVLPLPPFEMIYRILAVACLASLSSTQNFGPSNGQIPCGFVCTRNAVFRTSIDGVPTSAGCSGSKSDVTTRCNGCCQSYALWGGLTTEAASGFPSSDGQTCVCCVNNFLCRGNNGPIPTFAMGNGR